MFIPDPGSWFLPIPDPGSKNSNKRQGWKNFFCQTIFCSQKFHKTEFYFIFDMLKKNVAQFSKNYWSFYPKNCHQALKNIGLGSGIRDPRSGIRKKPIPGPGSRGQKGTGSRIPDPDPQHCKFKLSWTGEKVWYFSSHEKKNPKIWKWSFFRMFSHTFLFKIRGQF